MPSSHRTPGKHRDKSAPRGYDFEAEADGVVEATRFAVGTCEIGPPAPEDRVGLDATQVAEIVHDLKNPLATIALEMCLLAERLRDTASPDLRAVIARVNHNVEFLDRMVQNLLDSTSIDAGQFVAQCRLVELRALLEQVTDRMVATRDRGRVLLEAPARVVLSIDQLRIERVVANLLQNALKYASRSSGIVVRLEVAPGVARVSVIDAGPGMTSEETTYIFDRYRRTARAHAHEGSGLGLYVSKQIIEAHGGTIGVESVLGVGSRFFFDLPVL